MDPTQHNNTGISFSILMSYQMLHLEIEIRKLMLVALSCDHDFVKNFTEHKVLRLNRTDLRTLTLISTGKYPCGRRTSLD